METKAVADALERVSRSRTFQRAERHRSLLRYLVEKVAAGKADEIKEYTIALEVFGRPSYDPHIDSHVRVEIGKLRDRLEKYYAAEGSGDTLQIGIPKGSYTPVFRDMVQDQTEPPAAPAPPLPLVRWGLAALVVVLASSFLMWAPWRSPGPVFKPSIAVLPFEDLSPAKDQEYFCNGLTQELIDDLMNRQIFRVLPRSSVAQYKGHATDVRKIGEQLKVQAVVDGTVRKEKNRLRISVQLLDTKEGFQLWTKTFDRDFKNILDVQREIAESVAKSFHLELPDVRHALVRQGTRNAEAYLHYLRAADFYANDVPRSIEFYRAAVAADPGYALAWAGLASAHNRMVDWQMVPAGEARQEAMAAANKAIALDSGLAEAQHALGVAKLFYGRDWRAAEHALRRATELAPMDGDYRWQYARLILVPNGRFTESAELMRKAIALEPFKLNLYDQLATSLVRARQYDAVSPALEAARKIARDAPSPIVAQGVAAAYQGRYEEALARFEEAAQKRRSGWVLGHLGHTLAKLGRVDEARSVIAELEKTNASYDAAMVHVALGEKEQALAGLESAVAAFTSATLWMNVDYRLDDLHSHPRYAALVKTIGLSP